MGLPRVVVSPPGPRSRALASRLRKVESRNVTFLGEGFPVFWEEAFGCNVRDVDGNQYLDLTAAFGVALAGNAGRGGGPEADGSDGKVVLWCE